MKKIVQTAGRNALNEFAPQFAHFNDDVLLKSLIAVVQERNQPVDITPEFPDILLQSFPVHQPRSFHKT